MTITVKPVNDAPVANDDFYTTDEDTVLTVTAPGVLANDYDVDGDNLTVTLKTDVSHGTLILNGDGSFVYTPDENWYGTDSFVYNLISYPNINAEVGPMKQQSPSQLSLSMTRLWQWTMNTAPLTKPR